MFVLAADAVGAVAAAGTAAGAALEVIGRGEDYVFSFEVIVFRVELWRRRWGFVPVHRLFSCFLFSPEDAGCAWAAWPQSVELCHDTYCKGSCAQDQNYSV